jgi:endonuclease YncB( thermonuclease family)
MSFVPFSYRAWVKRMNWKAGTLDGEGAVVDGDTAHFLADRGMHEYQAANCRFWGVNTPELNDTDPAKRQAALAAKTWLRQTIEGKQVFVLSKGLDKYGRPLVIVWLSEADFGDNVKSVNRQLIDLGYAVAYMGELL